MFIYLLQLLICISTRSSARSFSVSFLRKHIFERIFWDFRGMSFQEIFMSSFFLSLLEFFFLLIISIFALVNHLGYLGYLFSFFLVIRLLDIIDNYHLLVQILDRIIAISSCLGRVE
jgi:hypothetical protein